MRTKLEIKSIFGKVLFEYECEDNTIAKTVTKAVKQKTDLSYADLSSANLRYADLRSADLSSANLSYADLSSANLSYADLRSADLRSADLSSADLRYADLSYADLRSANLSSANLRYADLSSANLSYADLSYADLRSAKTDKRYIQIGCIGSRKDVTTYCFEDDKINCGCFEGTLKEFEDKVIKVYDEDSQFRKEYIGAIRYIESLK